MSSIASVSNTLKIWDFKGKEILPNQSCNLNFNEEILSDLSWNHTNQVIAVGGTNKRINLVQVNNGSILSNIPFNDNEILNDVITSLCFSGNSRYLSCGANNIIYLWDLKRRTCKTKLIGHNGIINKLRFIPDGGIVSGDSNGSIRIWDIQSNTSSTEMNMDNINPYSLECLEISPSSSNRIASGYSDGSLCIWDAETSSLIRKQKVHTSHLTSLGYSPKNPRLVATCGRDGRLSLVDTGSKIISEPSAFIDVGDILTSVSFNEDAIHAAVGTNSGHILLYDWRNLRKPICKVEAHNPYPIKTLSFQVSV
jgi:WD40 repeat protein